LLSALRSDGWWLAANKTFLRPTTVLSYTGFLVDFNARTVRVDPNKASKALAELRAVVRPLDSAIAQSCGERSPPATAAGASAEPPPPPTGSPPDPIAYRRQLVQHAIRSPNVTTLALGQPVDSDFQSPSPGARVNVRLVRPPVAPAPVAELTVLSEHEFANSHTLASATATAISAASADPSSKTAVVVIIPPRCFDVTRVLKEIPVGNTPVVVFTPDPTNSPAPAPKWCDPQYALPPHMPRTRDLPPAADLPPLPAQEGARMELTGQEFDAVRRSVGYLSWFQVALPFVGFWRASLNGLVRDGTWNPERAAAFDAVWSVLHVISDMTHSVDKGKRTLSIVTDASGSGWGATVHVDGNPFYFAGNLPASACTGSSTLREALAAVTGIRAAMSIGIPFDHVIARVDSTALVGATSGRAKSETVASALWPLAAWAFQGLRVDFEWQARSSASHRFPDALSAATGPAPWPLKWNIASRLWDRTGGWDLDLMAYGGHSAALSPAYATPSLSEASSSERRAVLSGIRPLTGTGWQGLSDQVSVPPSAVVIAYPLWSHLRDVISWWRSHPCHLLLLAPIAGGGEAKPRVECHAAISAAADGGRRRRRAQTAARANGHGARDVRGHGDLRGDARARARGARG